VTGAGVGRKEKARGRLRGAVQTAGHPDASAFPEGKRPPSCQFVPRRVLDAAQILLSVSLIFGHRLENLDHKKISLKCASDLEHNEAAASRGTPILPADPGNLRPFCIGPPALFRASILSGSSRQAWKVCWGGKMGAHAPLKAHRRYALRMA